MCHIIKNIFLLPDLPEVMLTPFNSKTNQRHVGVKELDIILLLKQG